MPGFQGVGLYDVLYFFIKALNNPKFTLMASAMAYHFFFSLLPTLLLTLIILSQMPFEPLKEGVIKFILQFFPEGGLDQATLESMAKTIMERYFQNAPNIWLVIISILLALWGSMRGVIGMMKAFSKQESLFDSVFKTRKWWELYSMAILILLSAGIIIVAGVSLRIALGHLLGIAANTQGLLSESWYIFLNNTVETIVTILTLFLLISSLYYLAPATQERWNFISPGAITASVITMIAAKLPYSLS
ncbi:MAG: YhjD/YihY/BrkB family envelope integrity protein [Bacteroidota bacterium]